ncbi:hypothetical protein L3Q82_024646 [Scortum barcoo]|uniref:Uncharacterized protein n=1 Tax=Scortum barcoo TaxID=214431 RepID=A0ACB8WR93_9TELE|nr:hypothetical protein L3Q82_024646 [Scortum barcoo]
MDSACSDPGDCSSDDNYNNFADDSTVRMEMSLQRQEVEQLALLVWSVELNAENCGDGSGLQWTLLFITILNNTVSVVGTFRFPGCTISQDLKPATNIKAIRKNAQQTMNSLCQLRKVSLPEELLTQIYTTIIHSVLCTSITVWFGSATKQNRTSLVPSIQDLYMSSVRKDLSQPVPAPPLW